MSRITLPEISKDELIAAIREGVRDAMWDMISHATRMPCADFFAAVEDGVAEGIARVHRSKLDFQNPPASLTSQPDPGNLKINTDRET